MHNVMIVGAGAVGGFFGAHLAKANPHVSFLLRPRTLSAVRERGLRIRSTGGTLTVHPQAASNPRDLPQPDLIILANKAYDLPEVLGEIEPVLTKQTVILTLQNGVDVEDRWLGRSASADRVQLSRTPSRRRSRLRRCSLRRSGCC